MAIASLTALALIVLTAPRLATALLRLPGSQAVELAVTGHYLRPQSYERAVGSREWHAGWPAERRALLELGLLHFNLGNQAAAGTPEQLNAYARSLVALQRAVTLSPAQPMAWLLTAAIHHELGARLPAAHALTWAVRTGHDFPTQARARTIVALAVWDLLEPSVRERLLDSIELSLEREPELVAQAAIAAGVADEVALNLAATSPDGATLAGMLKLAIESQREGAAP